MVKIFWFRKDLRLFDNRALKEFINDVKPDEKFIFLYVKNKNSFNYFGEMRISFLYESLMDLDNALRSAAFLPEFDDSFFDGYELIQIMNNEGLTKFGRENKENIGKCNSQQLHG